MYKTNRMMSSFLANATPATYYSYGQQSDFPNADLNPTAGQTASNYPIRSFHDLSSSSSSPTTSHHLQANPSENGTASAHYYSLANDNNQTNHTSSSLSNTPPSSQSTIMNSSNNGNSSNSLDLHLAHTQQMNGQLTNSGTPSNPYQTTAQLTPPPSVSTDGSHQSPVLTYPSYRDYTELSNSNNSINSTPTTTSSSSQNMNNSTPTTTASNGASQQQSTNQSPKSEGLNSMTAASGNPLLYAENNNAMDLDSGMSPSASASNTYTPSIHNPYHLAAAHQSNTSQFNLHHHSHSQSTNAFGHHHQPNPHQFANSQADGLINQHQHHLLPASYHQLHHSHLNSHNQIQTQPQHPHLHPQLNALNVAVHVHNFNPNPSIIPNSGSQANSSYLPDNPHLSATTPVSAAVNSAFTNGNGNSFINSSGLLAPAQPFLPNNAGSNCGGQSNGLPTTNGKPTGSSSSAIANNPNNPNSRNDSPLGPYSNLTNNAIGQSIACDSAAASASLLLDAHNTNGSGSSTPNPAATNGFHSLMYHLNPLSSNSPSPTLQAQQSQLHLAQHHHHHLHQNQFVQHPPHHHQLHPHQQLPPQSAQPLIAGGHPVGSLNHHLQNAGPPGAGNQFGPQHAYNQLNNATPNHLNQPMHPMHFKMQTANSNHQMVNSFNSSAGIVNANQSGNGNSRNSSASSESKHVYKWMQVKRSQPKTGKFDICFRSSNWQ